MSDHFYTTSTPERSSALGQGYASEGIACYVLAAVTSSRIPLYRLWNPRNGDHFYTTNATERDNAANNLGYRAEGIAGYVPTDGEGLVPLYRLYHGGVGDHFYTTSAAERDNAVTRHGYTYEGVACLVSESAQVGTSPLLRSYSPRTNDHFYTTSAPEHANAIANYGYTDEGVACHIYDGPDMGPVPLYRCWKPSSGDHFYTTDSNERDNAVNSHGYRAEGIACYVFPSAEPGTVPLYRAWHPGSGDHFYTTSNPEWTNATTNLGYRAEGIACYVYSSSQAGRVPLYRLVKAYDAFLDINLICVADDTFTAADRTELSAALSVARSIYAKVGLQIRDVAWWSISAAEAGALATIDSNAEATDLTQRWTCDNAYLDVFVVRVMNGADGWSAVNGPCDKNAKGMNGSVVSLNGNKDNSGNTLAHEMGHYLGLNHISDSGNFIGGDGSSDAWTGIYAWQGDAMKKHCFVRR